MFLFVLSLSFFFFFIAHQYHPPPPSPYLFTHRYLNIVNVSNEAKERGLCVGQRIMKADGVAIFDSKELENKLKNSSENSLLELVVTDPDPDSSCDDLMKSTLDAADVCRGIALPGILSIVMDLLVKIRDDAIVQSLKLDEEKQENNVFKDIGARALRNLELIVATLQALLALFQIVPDVDRDVWGGPKENVQSTFVSLKSLIRSGPWEDKCSHIKTEIVSIRQIAKKILSHGVSHFFTIDTNAMNWFETQKNARSHSLSDISFGQLSSMSTPSLNRSLSLPSVKLNSERKRSSSDMRESLSNSSLKNIASSMGFGT